MKTTYYNLVAYFRAKLCEDKDVVFAYDAPRAIQGSGGAKQLPFSLKAPHIELEMHYNYGADKKHHIDLGVTLPADASKTRLASKWMKLWSVLSGYSRGWGSASFTWFMQEMPTRINLCYEPYEPQVGNYSSSPEYEVLRNAWAIIGSHASCNGMSVPPTSILGDMSQLPFTFTGVGLVFTERIPSGIRSLLRETCARNLIQGKVMVDTSRKSVNLYAEDMDISGRDAGVTLTNLDRELFEGLRSHLTE